jgi:bifunctional non-homologous end joining protein LigD
VQSEQVGTFLIGVYVPGGAGFDELILGTKDQKGLHFVARLKAGFVPATRAAIADKIKRMKPSECPFYNLP